MGQASGQSCRLRSEGVWGPAAHAVDRESDGDCINVGAQSSSERSRSNDSPTATPAKKSPGWTSACRAWTGSRRPAVCPHARVLPDPHPHHLRRGPSRVGGAAGRRERVLAQGLGPTPVGPSRPCNQRGRRARRPLIARRLVEEAEARPQPVAGVPQVLASLSERELDVMRQVAAGLTNAEISAQIVVSEATSRAMSRACCASSAHATGSSS